MSWRSIVAALTALLVAMPLLAGEASAQRPDRDRAGDRGGRDSDRARGGSEWELLGTRRIGRFGMDRDAIEVGRRDGKFRSIGVQAKEGSVFVAEISVTYGNGEVQRIDLRQHLREGERSRPVDLQGRDRFIKRIEIAARAGRGNRGPTVIEVYGESEASEPWELLGEKRVDRRLDRDVIPVGRREGRFSKIALEVKDNDVEIKDLKVFFLRGPPQDVQVRERIPEGGRTRPIDLMGDDRIIDRIELVYRTRGRGERATVAVYGLKGDDRPPPPPRRAHWEELGCQKVGFGADKDVIKVGRREGRFDAIRLQVKRSDVLILSLRVVYARGPADDFDVQARIRAGETTRPFDLRGERRAIDRIELVYTSIPSLKGAATLCAEGRQ